MGRAIYKDLIGKDTDYIIMYHQPTINELIQNLIDMGELKISVVYDYDDLLMVANQCLIEYINSLSLVNDDDYRELTPGKVKLCVKKRIIPCIKKDNPNGLCLPKNTHEITRLGEANLVEYNVSIDYPTDMDMRVMRDEIDSVLDTLTTREARVLRLRYGLEDGRERTLEEVAKEFGVIRERIRQIEAKALRKMRHPSRAKRIRDFLGILEDSYYPLMVDPEEYAKKQKAKEHRYEHGSNVKPRTEYSVTKETVTVTTITKTERTVERYTINGFYDDDCNNDKLIDYINKQREQDGDVLIQKKNIMTMYSNVTESTELRKKFCEHHPCAKLISSMINNDELYDAIVNKTLDTNMFTEKLTSLEFRDARRGAKSWADVLINRRENYVFGSKAIAERYDALIDDLIHFRVGFLMINDLFASLIPDCQLKLSIVNQAVILRQPYVIQRPKNINLDFDDDVAGSVESDDGTYKYYLCGVY